MKTYLKIAIGTLFMGGLFTSCSQDIDGNESAEQDILKGYETVFKNAFGDPAPNQSWGFGETIVSTRAYTRTIQPSFNFPSDAAASKFLDDVPEGVEKLTQNVGSANNWIDETWTGDINIWGQGTAENGWVAEGGTLYIKGNCDFSNRSFYFAGNSELYIVKGATLTLGVNNGSGNLQTNTNIYIAPGAKLIAKGELMLNNGLHIYNHGTIEAPKLSTNNNSVLYNSGTVTVTNKISVENTLSVIVNDGTITATDLNTAGSGKVENNGNVTISGTTFVNSNDNTWVNNGQYHTGNFLYNAGSDEVINNCHLIVDEEFNINLGDNPGNGNFKMDAGSSVETRFFNGGGNWSDTYAGTYSNFAGGGPFYIYMGTNSVFKVTETATMNATKADYGIYGPSNGGYAVFQAKDIVAGKANQGFEVTYGNNLYVYASDSHFAQGHDGNADHPYIAFKGNAKIYAPGFESGMPNITIAKTECNPGFNGGDDPDPSVVRIIAEDLSWGTENGDFDFNDVVFDVELIDNGSNIRITLQAAGGTLPIRIAGQFEVHDKFGVPTGTIVNTGTRLSVSRPKVSWTFPNSDSRNYQLVNGQEVAQSYGSTVKEVAYNLPVEVQKLVNGSRSWVELLAPVGKAAAKIAVDNTYDWCEERQSIDDKYFDSSLGKGKFSMYVKKLSPYTEDGSWYK